jgi:phenylpropionate dioxygenase-like ring-hydroxylating dioxygenase large terminal subunit
MDANMSNLPPLNKPLSDNAATSFTLSSDYYNSPQLFELEKRQIFYKTWQYVAHESMLPDPGDYVSLRLCDENVFVIRSADGELRSFYNVCRHRAHELLQGSGNVRKMIVCPYHAWSYNNQGELLRAPMSEHRPEFDKADFCLRAIRLEVFCGCIFINLDENCSSLHSIAGDLEKDIQTHIPYLDELKYCGSNLLGETRIDAGWKVVVDNYVECYHCRPAHKDFASLIDMSTYQVEIHDYWSRQYGADIRYQNNAYEIDPEIGIQSSFFWYLWPNTTFNVLPGSNELGVFVVRPIDVKSSDFGGHSFAVDGKAYQPRVDYAATVLAPEDIELCESVQRGLQSQSYDQGAYMVNPQHYGESEYALHHFHRLVQSSLNTD